MVKRAATARSSAAPRTRKRAQPPNEKLASCVAAIDQIRPKERKRERLVRLLQSWLCDDSGYDEVTWPQLKKALTEERTSRGARRLFDA